MTLPTQRELVGRIAKRESEDVFGFEMQDLAVYLDRDHIRPFLKEDVSVDDWTPDDHTREAVLARMLDYMPFAWEKANDQRGLSANRSVQHFIAWTFAAGDREFSDELIRMYDEEYQHYGKEILERVCQHYGWDAGQWDDGKRVDS